MVRSLGRLSARSQGLVFALLTLSVLMSAWRTWLGPERLLRASRQSRLDSAVAELARLRITTAGLPNLQREVHALEVKLAESRAASTAQAPATLLEAVHGLATLSGVDLISFSHVPAARDAPQGGQRIQLGLDGGFYHLVGFLARLSASGQLAAAPDVTLKSQPESIGGQTVSATVAAEARSAATPIVLGEDIATSPGLTDDRRDPFLPPRVGRSAGADDAGPAAPGAAGLSGISANDVTVTGIVRAGGRMSAILQGPNRRTFVAGPHDRLLDATVKSVDAGGVVFVVLTPRRSATQPSEFRKPIGKQPGAVR